jgi:hypothetical protein
MEGRTASIGVLMYFATHHQPQDAGKSQEELDHGFHPGLFQGHGTRSNFGASFEPISAVAFEHISTG